MTAAATSAAAYRAGLLTFDAGGRLVYHRDGLLAVDRRGRVLRAGAWDARQGRGAHDWRGRLIIPGLIDAHCHLSQYPAVAADGLELLPWLRRHIFPLESGFKGEAARQPARRFFSELAAHGTTCAAVYTSIWQDSTQVCFEEAQRAGLRVIMGKVMMDRGSYDAGFGRKHPGVSRRDVSLRESEELCRLWHERDGGRILYAFTPRFALSCSTELLAGAARLADRYGAYVQTHLSENRREVTEVARAFPGSHGYLSVYDRAGLLGPRTILAHCVWLSEPEHCVLERRRPAVAHCPTSNAFLGSGIMDLGRLRRGEVPVALGSDVAGGPTLSLFEVMRQAVYGQRLARAHGLFEPSETTAADAFYMATLGGARALGLGDRIGSLAPGKDADFVALEPSSYLPGAGTRARAAERVVAQLVYRADRAAVRATYVAGRRVWGSAPVAQNVTKTAAR